VPLDVAVCRLREFVFIDTNIVLTTLNIVLFESLTGSQLIEEFLAFYGTRRFIAVFTGARHVSLS
jgi:hypothetical protein